MAAVFIAAQGIGGGAKRATPQAGPERAGTRSPGKPGPRRRRGCAQIENCCVVGFIP
jgi:hypothetical protein